MPEQSSTIEVHSAEESGHPQQSFISPDVEMMLLTWVSFFLLLGILYKFAWKPILDGLDAREGSIRKAVDDAERIKLELEKIHQTREKMLEDTEVAAKEIIAESRTAAVEAAKVIQQKTKDEVKIILENANREINSTKEQAQAELRRESAEIALKLAGKLLEENLDNDKNRRIVDQFIKTL